MKNIYPKCHHNFGLNYKLKPETIKHIEKTTKLHYKEMTTLSLKDCEVLMQKRGAIKKTNKLILWFSKKYKEIGEKFGLLEKRYNIYTHID